MKYLGNSLRPEGYTVVKYLARLPQNDRIPVTSPADPDGYYTVSQEYARILKLLLRTATPRFGGPALDRRYAQPIGYPHPRGTL